MTANSDDTTTSGAGTPCPRCEYAVDARDRYCRSCGFKILQDSNEVVSYVEALLPKKIDEALGARLKDQKIVEIETSEQIAERAMKWMKLGGFFLAIPLFLFGVLISFLGFKTYADIEKLEQKIAEAQPRLEVSVKRAEALENSIVGTEQRFASIQQRIDGLDGKVQTNDARQQTLEQDLKNLKDRISFSDSKALTSDLRRSLEDVLVRYIKYLENIGFSHLDQKVEILSYSKDEPPPWGSGNGVNTTYSDGKIFIHRDLLSDPTVAVRAYTDHALSKTGDNMLVGEIHLALADYFTVSFFDDPALARKSAATFGVSTPYLRNLDNNNQRNDQSSDYFKNGEALGGAFWQCRVMLGKNLVDKVLFRAMSAAETELENSATSQKDDKSELRKMKVFARSVKDFAGSFDASRGADCFETQFRSHNVPL